MARNGVVGAGLAPAQGDRKGSLLQMKPVDHNRSRRIAKSAAKLLDLAIQRE